MAQWILIHAYNLCNYHGARQYLQHPSFPHCPGKYFSFLKINNTRQCFGVTLTMDSEGSFTTWSRYSPFQLGSLSPFQGADGWDAPFRNPITHSHLANVPLVIAPSLHPAEPTLCAVHRLLLVLALLRASPAESLSPRLSPAIGPAPPVAHRPRPAPHAPRLAQRRKWPGRGE